MRYDSKGGRKGFRRTLEGLSRLKRPAAGRVAEGETDGAGRHPRRASSAPCAPPRCGFIEASLRAPAARLCAGRDSPAAARVRGASGLRRGRDLFSPPPTNPKTQTSFCAFTHFLRLFLAKWEKAVGESVSVVRHKGL